MLMIVTGRTMYIFNHKSGRKQRKPTQENKHARQYNQMQLKYEKHNKVNKI